MRREECVLQQRYTGIPTQQQDIKVFCVEHASNYGKVALEQARTTIGMADSWATSNNMKLMRIGFQHNSGLKDIYRELKILFTTSSLLSKSDE